MAKKHNASEQDNQEFYWFKRNAIQPDGGLNTVGRMLMQIGLLQPYKMAARTQAKGFGVSVDTARRARRIAVTPFTHKGIEAPLFEKKGKEYLKWEVEGQSWNERFNACPYIRSTYFRLVTVRVDLAAAGKGYGISVRKLAEMIGATVTAARKALENNAAKDEVIFEIEPQTGGRYSYRPRLQLIAGTYEKKVKKLVKQKPDQEARYILETECGIHGPKAKAFYKDYIVPARKLQLIGTYRKLVKALVKLYNDITAMRLASTFRRPVNYSAGSIIPMYLQWIGEQNYSISPTTKVLSIKAEWFWQFRRAQSRLEQSDIITGEPVLSRG
jgi:hypothetical protein